MDESESQGKTEPEAAKPTKRKRRIVLFVLLGMMLAGAGAGALLVPRFASRLPWPRKADATVDKDEPPAAVAVLDSIVIDLRESSGELHHLKVGVALELKSSFHGEEFKRYEPRVRDATISYLRTLTFEEVTAPANLERIRTTLGERVAVAIGHGNVRRVLFTDFVAQ